MKLVSVIRQIALVVLLASTGIAGAEEYAPEGDSEGVIQELDFGANTMLINGSSYQVSSTVKVEIGGSFGAFTMLTKGMKIEFTYQQFSDGVRRVVFMREVSEVEEI